MKEQLRSSWTLDGAAIFLVFDAGLGKYRVGTRWYWMVSFESIYDACDAFEALEMMEGHDHTAVGKWLACEISRVPRHMLVRRGIGPSRIADLVECVERRLAGLRPLICGSKGSVVKWVAAARTATA